jgi:hypothetical protein
MSTTPPTPGPPLGQAAVDALILDTGPWLSCDDCFERMDTYVEALVDDASYDDPAMAGHLRGCPACAEEADALVELLTGHHG